MLLKITSCFLFLFFVSSSLYSQNKATKVEDSILKVIPTLKTDAEKFKAYKKIASKFLGESFAKEELYLTKALFVAEQSRDRTLIANATIECIDQWLDMGGLPEREEKAMQLADKGIILAKESQLNSELAVLLTKKAYLHRSKGDNTKALKVNEEAANYADLSVSDSVKVITEMSWANTLIAKDESLLAFKKYMNALTLAEVSGNKTLQMNVYKRIGDFYAKVDQIEKAKDYYTKVIKLAQETKDENTELNAYSTLVTYCGANKDFVTAKEYLKILEEKANASKNDLIKNQVLISEINLLFQEDMKKVAAYIRTNPKLINDLNQMGYKTESDKALGIMYSLENNKDSAEYYFQKAKTEMNVNANPSTVIGWKMAYAMHLERNGNIKGAIDLMNENLKMTEQFGSLTGQKMFREQLDSLYIKAGDKQMEVANKLILYKLKDSLDKQQKAKEVLNIEIDAENKKLERETKAKTERLQKKHNLQYMGITAGIVALFVLLAGLGRLRVKPWLIRALGFFSFILLFEFIILIADKEIHHLTHGDPLQILLIKIVLIALLLPLHHWLEHKAIHYLLRHQEKKEVAKAN